MNEKGFGIFGIFVIFVVIGSIFVAVQIFRSFVSVDTRITDVIVVVSNPHEIDGQKVITFVSQKEHSGLFTPGIASAFRTFHVYPISLVPMKLYGQYINREATWEFDDPVVSDGVMMRLISFKVGE